jgi:hypothetical protein
MVDKAVHIYADAFQKCVIPAELVNEFISAFEAIEKQEELGRLWGQ